MTLPNQLTILRIVLTPVFVYCFFADFHHAREISLGIFLIAALTDWYDGWLARKFNYITAWGKFWDPIADKILTAGAFLTLVHEGVFMGWPVYIILTRDFMVTIFRAYAEHKGYSFPTSFYAKLKTLLQMIFLYYVLILYIFSGSDYLLDYRDIINVLINPDVVFVLLLTIMGITIHTGADYFIQQWGIVKKIFSKS